MRTSLSAVLLLAIAVGKILTTSLTIGSGGSGGVFGPSMVIGGCAGGSLGVFLHGLWPAAVPHPATFVILGMAGFFAAAAKTPFSTLVIVSEMTGDYRLLLAGALGLHPGVSAVGRGAALPFAGLRADLSRPRIRAISSARSSPASRCGSSSGTGRTPTDSPTQRPAFSRRTTLRSCLLTPYYRLSARRTNSLWGRRAR